MDYGQGSHGWNCVKNLKFRLKIKRERKKGADREKLKIYLGPIFHLILHAFSFISNTFNSNSRLKFANFQNLSRKILRTEL